ncbi:MAG: recombination-associated protein RdgC [Myxococcales bacterium]|nr:recombination-associated protein RdgC [Myxococcales bacterium]MCB9519932.1 recombination-associated protein RdgC [Myxococcales bacterium]MCB9533160.1 recombination-associated protein RdgC [Myxococcales bacterium]
MGARKGSISYSLFHVDGDIAKTSRDELLERIREFAFSPLTPESEEDTVHGWVVLDDMLATDFTPDNVFLGEYIALGLRVDRWALPGALFKAHIERRTREVLAETGKARLFKSEKLAIREDIGRQLKRQTLPAAAAIDMVWAVERGEVRFWSQSNRALEMFESLFESTFAVRLVNDSAYVAALHCRLADELVGALADVEQARFTSFE